MKMEKPTVEAVRFTSADVIATSGQLGVKLSGFGDLNHTDYENNTITVGRQDYTPASSPQDVITALESAGQPSGYSEYETIFNAGGTEKSLGDLWIADDENWGVFNGTYTWNKDGSYWKWSSN